MLSGTKVGLVTGVAVLVYTALFRAIPAGLAREVVEAVVVLATATLVSFLPAQWVVARGSEGIAGAAAVGLWGTIVFTAIDIVVLRPANHLVTIYPWTWDAVGGLSTWWYLPIWWMLGTVVAWILPPAVAWGASYFGLWLGALVAVRLSHPLVMLATAVGVAALSGFGALWAWVRVMRRVPHLLSHHMAPRASEERAAIAAA